MGKKKSKSAEVLLYSESAIRNNLAIMEYCKTSMAALSGSTAGLLGLTSFYGFGFYVVAVVILWLMLLYKAGADWEKSFISRQAILTNGFFGGLFTYVLFWTFIYGMVHVY